MSKLVNIKNLSEGTPFRIPKSQALALMAEQPGKFAFMNKSSTIAFFKRLASTTRNEEALKNVDFTTKQKDNFVTEENGKVIGYVLKGTRTHAIEAPETEEKAAEHKNWLENLIEKHCINPNDHTLKNNLIARMAVFFGLFKDFMSKKKVKPTASSVDLPLYQRYILGYGTVAKIKMA